MYNSFVHKQPKSVEFLGGALNDLRDFPLLARREAGYQIDKVQHGEEPDDWKPMNLQKTVVRRLNKELPRLVHSPFGCPCHH